MNQEKPGNKTTRATKTRATKPCGTAAVGATPATATTITETPLTATPRTAASAATAPILRAAREKDLPEITGLEQEIFGVHAWSENSVREELTNPTRRYTVLADSRQSPEILGYAGVFVAGQQADVQTVAVRADCRGRGYGRIMLNELLRIAAQAGAREIFLEVRADNQTAIRLYESNGFKRIDRRAGYYQPDGVDALVMKAPIPATPDGTAEAHPKMPASLTPPPSERTAFAPVAVPQPPAGPAPSAPATTTTATIATAAAPKNAAQPRAWKGGAKHPLILGIETSCDETGVGIVRGRRLLANAVHSSMAEHAKYGGVIPEIAARAHLHALNPTIEAALTQARVPLMAVDAIAVTAGPGLSGALMVGVAAAKTLALSLGIPVYGVNHLVGHVSADLLDETAPVFPTVALLVSGGHTSLLLVNSLEDDVRLLGETIDDAAGEAFDKVARLLGLPYPGGPHIDAAAAAGDAQAIRFPRGLTKPKDMQSHRYDFSFSGVKTSVARWVEQARRADVTVPVADVAASFREAVVDVLLQKTLAACEDYGVPRLLLGGGVAANARLRQVAEERCTTAGVSLKVPPLSLCTDNGAMIASLGALLVEAGKPASPLGFGADSTLPVTRILL